MGLYTSSYARELLAVTQLGQASFLSALASVSSNQEIVSARLVTLRNMTAYRKTSTAQWREHKISSAEFSVMFGIDSFPHPHLKIRDFHRILVVFM